MGCEVAQDTGVSASQMLEKWQRYPNAWWEELQRLRTLHCQLCLECRQATAARQTRILQAVADYQTNLQRIEQELEGRIARLETEEQQAIAEAHRTFDTADREATVEHQRVVQQATNVRQSRITALEEDVRFRYKQLRESLAQKQREASAAHGAWLEQWQRRLDALAALHQQIVRQLSKWSVNADAVDYRHTIVQQAGQVSWEEFERCVAAARNIFALLRQHPAARFLHEGWAVLVGLGASVSSVYPAAQALGWDNPWWLAACVTSGGIGGWLSRWLGQRWVACRARPCLPEIRAHLARAHWQLDQLREKAEKLQTERGREIDEWFQREQRRIEESRCAVLHEIDSRYEQEIHEAEERLRTSRQMAAQQLEQRLNQIRVRYAPEQTECRNRLESARTTFAEEHSQRLAQINERYASQLEDVKRQWQTAWRAFLEKQHEAIRLFETHHAPWEKLADPQYPLPESPAPVIPFGWLRSSWRTDPVLVPDAINEAPYELIAPAVLAVPDCPSLVVYFDEPARKQTIQLLQTVMLRWLVAIPPGKLRFTLIDPLGLGQSFSPFMHLADYDERLVGHRIWTDAEHIRRRMAELTEHVETVIQKYLRNEYRSIHEYNVQAGELAEPIQLIVVAGFPEGFSEDAARKMASLAWSGPSCGVFLLLAIEHSARLPAGIAPTDFHQHSMVLEAAGTVFRLKDLPADIELKVDLPPSTELVNRILRRWGQAAVGADRVEVPFDRVVPDEEAWWTQTSRSGIEVPIGQSGARRLQWLKLGTGTSQHLVVAGKTGSGKSTLFHTIILSASLRYPPSELVFYLVDFKKGVEFKDYVEYRLPHAEVIAIESEREFGVSVLKKLDDELERRGRLFRDAAVQDIATFRSTHPHVTLPRILVIVDEFQEFFVKEDSLARDAALLLDRLVRQGRAFGIHVLLGSQTLAGAYSLARSTLGQMAVRIALQCSEADAHVILSEDNTAARLLSRPGEAIYNDQNGMVEGNHPFQVVWLPDSKRRMYLEKLDKRSRTTGLPMRRAIIFEGNRPARLEENDEFLRCASGQSAAIDAPTAWLGEAIAIGPAVRVAFQRQPGHNLLCIGQDQQMARQLMTAALVGLWVSAQRLGRTRRFDIICGHASRQHWLEIPLGPGQLAVHSTERVPEVIETWHAEWLRRTNRLEPWDPWFLIIDSLGEVPALRRDEEDAIFGRFSMDDQAFSASRQWRQLLTEGPTRAMHCVVACDSYHTFARWCERTVLRDFVFRVLLQMNPTDSTHFIDSPAAHHLGPHRALLYRDDRGEVERFRPFGQLPPWNQLVGRAE